MCTIPIEIINNIFLYVSSPISKLLNDELFMKYHFTIRIIETNIMSLYNYWIKRKVVVFLKTSI